MNFTSAIQAHANWKLRLYAACQNSSKEVIDVSTLAKDDACELGKWLRGGAVQRASDPEFGGLISAHAAFHRAAASIGTMIEGGRRAEAEGLLGTPEAEYCKLSVRVVGYLMGFRTRYGDA